VQLTQLVVQKVPVHVEWNRVRPYCHLIYFVGFLTLAAENVPGTRRELRHNSICRFLPPWPRPLKSRPASTATWPPAG
jgi:hypothetical protein